MVKDNVKIEVTHVDPYVSGSRPAVDVNHLDLIQTDFETEPVVLNCDFSRQASSIGTVEPTEETDINFLNQLNKSVLVKKSTPNLFRPTNFFCVLIATFIVTVISFPIPPVIGDETGTCNVTKNDTNNGLNGNYCTQDCKIMLVESIPYNLTYSDDNFNIGNMSTYEAWVHLLTTVQSTLDVTSFYWTLNGEGDDGGANGAWEGENIYALMKKVGARIGGNNFLIAQDVAKNDTTLESQYLEKNGLASVRSLNMSNWFVGGVLHTKLWVADLKQVYVGSANMDWRSLTQVKELGAYITGCSCLGSEAEKLFQTYWYMGQVCQHIPQHWPQSYQTNINASNPMNISLNGIRQLAYFSFSPPGFLPPGRENDLDAILDTINNAKKWVRVAVMDYAPAIIYTPVQTYWPYIDDALRSAAYRGTKVQLLFSRWKHTRKSLYAWTRSLMDINEGIPKGVDGSIEVRIFYVPSYNEDQANLPYSRVNHNKYLVTESVAYIGTSNWSGDYFTNTAGVGLTVKVAGEYTKAQYNGSVCAQLNSIFLRDWNSMHAQTPYLEKEQKIALESTNVLDAPIGRA